MTTATRYKVIDTALCIGESVFEGEVVVVLADEYDHDTHELREDRDSQKRACIHWIRKSEELRAQVEVMNKEAEAVRDLLRKIAPHFAAPPGMGYLHQWIEAALWEKL